MRLHSMTVTAFGPYPGGTRIDFDELTSAGLFLLHGATGAGKTSVLDAVCYALYGGVPGARQGMRLRSDHADPYEPTEVVLELTVGGRRLEITRRPEQPRPKKGRAGSTTDKALTLLRERAGGEWKALSRSHREIGDEIKLALGMSREQFCQVVMLPQGEFARFLRSDAADRAALLGKLFDTGRFEAVEQWLAGRRRTAEAAIRAQDEALVAVAHRMAQAAGPIAASHPMPELTAGETELTDTVTLWADATRAEAAERRDVAAVELTAAEAAHRAAGHALETSRQTAALQQRHAAARTRDEELEAARGEFDQHVRRLERAAAADRVAPALHARDRAAQDQARAARRRAETTAPLPPDLTGAGADDLTGRERQIRQDLGRLDAARRAEQRAAAIVADRARLEREAAADDELERDTGGWLTTWDQRRDTCRARLDTAQEAATAAEALAARLETALRRRDAARRCENLDAQEREAAEALLAARTAAAGAHEHWLALKERRLRSVAAELAATLATGTDCPVCGSADHPRPARPGDDHVDGAAEEAALAAHRRAETDRGRAETALLTLRDRLAAARADAGDGTSVQLAADVDALTTQEATARRTAGDVHPAREELRRAEAEYTGRLDTQRETQKRQAARASQREALDTELDGLRAQLAEAGGGDGGIAERADRLERRARLLAEAAEAARTLADAEMRLTDAEAQLADAARSAGFDHPQQAAEALLTTDERADLQRRVETHRDKRAAVQAELTDHQVREAAAAPPADPEAARRAMEAATTALRTASAAADTWTDRDTQLARLAREAARQTQDLAPLREEHARLRRLSHLASGTSAENELRMRLESYVLAARLEQVAAAASVRLRRMSSGRYTLAHTDARASGRTRSGLGLRVVDAWTGTERDTATLSGGETFSASLALALGLADVVTDEAGAVRLDTLFIDEGFGSLDDQTLDEVLDVLDSLRERDRAVGIVSHVADLRARIPAQLEVVKGRTGSFVRHRVPAPARHAATGAGGHRVGGQP
ncbi:AAA family ATPase [Streptantibioticus silvisoli]|uniref:Nuclease SbcCD subunit C n=1 Tax=Streptantibioticus silvisoli TaxID=2705255 RepID=A0ABT6VTR0_9ACTN|nr:SMC family ATPase [Streptantibioticus silvisoli]MDI5961868.1 SMC family ATPase [Streptantibioticus silvisoli]